MKTKPDISWKRAIVWGSSVSFLALLIIVGGIVLMWAYLFVSLMPRPWEEHIAALPELHAAVESGDLAAVKQRIEAGDDVDFQASRSAHWPDGVTPLMIAARRGYADIAAYLLERGAALDLELPQSGDRAIHMATGAAIKTLLLHGADVDARNRHGQTPLMTAAIGAHLTGDGLCDVLTLIKADADPTARDHLGRNVIEVLQTWQNVNPAIFMAIRGEAVCSEE
jgi:hypothetical protein